MRFNPPPNWPTPPQGWAPPPNWRPDASWGSAPEGWQLWVDDDTPAAPQKKRWVRPRKILIGATAVLVGLAVIGSLADDDTSEPTKAAASSAVSSPGEGSASEEAAPNAQAERDADEDAQRVAQEETERQAREEAERKAAAAAEAAAAAAEAARKDPASYSALGDRDWLVISKDPDAHVGQKIVLHGYVTQFDSATGPTTFRANTGGEHHSDWYEYDVNTVVAASEPGMLGNVVTDDLVTMYVEIAGALTYDTTLGGSMTVPQVTVNIIEVTGSV